MTPIFCLRRAIAVPLAALTLVASAGTAEAGGMFLPARGARPLGRAGSYVAGADDLEAVYYNPAGLAGTGHASALIDVGLVFQKVHYDRIDSGGNAQPGVDNNNGILPIPFLGVSWRPEALKRRVTFALAAWAPWTGIPKYTFEGPQRYSLVSLDGTSLLVAALAVSVRIIPELYIGASIQNMFGRVANQITLSSCTELNCAPEDRNFDAPTQTRVNAPFTPSGNFGALFVHRYVRVGASFQLPYFVRGSGTVKTRLPPDPQFDGSVVVGDKIDVSLDLPWSLRFGVEARPTTWTRFELGFDYEAWQMQQKLAFTPRGVYIDHVVGVGRYNLQPLSVDRSMKGVWSIHFGGEVDLTQKRWVTLRAGYLFESSAVPDETLTVLTPDGDKHLIALGVSVRIKKIRLDLGYGHYFQADRTITNSRSLQQNPIQPALAVAVGNGRYHVENDVLSLGFEGRF